jgi:hypothetical protein
MTGLIRRKVARVSGSIKLLDGSIKTLVIAKRCWLIHA